MEPVISRRRAPLSFTFSPYSISARSGLPIAEGVETSTHAETRTTEHETGLPRGARFQAKEETRLVAACRVPSMGRI